MRKNSQFMLTLALIVAMALFATGCRSLAADEQKQRLSSQYYALSQDYAEIADVYTKLGLFAANEQLAADYAALGENMAEVGKGIQQSLDEMTADEAEEILKSFDEIQTTLDSYKKIYE